ncbi:MAG: type II toxin-antitoxin system HicB family antitoxin [Planctomycetes bacterium]|nr:type II toxin-antitoxin system HicB family antitoxin [Planctomycetota bacterium]
MTRRGRRIPAARGLLSITAMKMRVVVRKSPRSGAFLAYCPELPGCSATGPTREVAMERLRDRTRLLREKGNDR